MIKLRAFVVARWVAAVGLGGWTARQFFVSGTTEDRFGGALHGFYALAGLLGTVVLVAPEVVGWAVTPLNRMVDAVLLPGESEPPPADYRLAHFYQQQRRYDEACEEYLKIIHYHPRELAAYLEGMMTAAHGQQADLITKFHRFGRRAFRDAATRSRLRAVLEDSRLTAAALADMPETDADETPDVPALEAGETFPAPEPPPGPPDQ